MEQMPSSPLRSQGTGWVMLGVVLVVLGLVLALVAEGALSPGLMSIARLAQTLGGAAVAAGVLLRLVGRIEARLMRIERHLGIIGGEASAPPAAPAGEPAEAYLG